ncbi:hypothetical protein [Halospeciosus flavus]|uniref:DUF1206 domain-containing protein n=1 Tax=Halospeciosus flavus TaxID=3032283 RepID=A0ABD5Z123_9EURY|nr:hypothetical protein [Halospeciosus flavus]
MRPGQKAAIGVAVLGAILFVWSFLTSTGTATGGGDPAFGRALLYLARWGGAGLSGVGLLGLGVEYGYHRYRTTESVT